MSKEPVIPSLSEDGWITDSRKKLDRLMSYFMLTDGAQSYLFNDQLTSLPVIYYKTINKPEEFARQAQEALTELLNKYFEDVKVRIKVDDTNETSHLVSVSLVAQVIDSKGAKLELEKLTELDTSSLRRVVELNDKAADL